MPAPITTDTAVARIMEIVARAREDAAKQKEAGHGKQEARAAA